MQELERRQSLVYDEIQAGGQEGSAPWPPDFQPTAKITEERLGVVNFGPEGWLLPEEVKLFRHLIILRQNALAFCPAERGLLKHSYGLPYVIPVIEHTPWQKKPIPIQLLKSSILRQETRWKTSNSTRQPLTHHWEDFSSHDYLKGPQIL